MRGPVLAAIFAAALSANVMVRAQTEMKPPVAKKDPKVMKIHVYEITDNYSILRDRNNENNPEVVKYM